jgi:hypothetical protein
MNQADTVVCVLDFFIREVVTDEAIRAALAATSAPPARVVVLDDITDAVDLPEHDLLCVRKRLAGDWKLHVEVFPMINDESRCLELVRRVAATLGTAVLTNHDLDSLRPEHYAAMRLLEPDGERLVDFDDDQWEATGSVRVTPR